MKQILFIGNSYTFFNDMPTSIFAPMARERGYEVEVTAVTRGGYRLSQFADPENEEGKRLRETVAGKHYDCVVLQDQSCHAIVDEARFMSGIEGVKHLLAGQADAFVLYATWGRHEGSEMLDTLHLTSAEMTAQLSAAYNRAARAFGMRVAEVGLAFAAHPEMELYHPDLSHPSPEGSRLAAKTILDAVVQEL